MFDSVNKIQPTYRSNLICICKEEAEKIHPYINNVEVAICNYSFFEEGLECWLSGNNSRYFPGDILQFDYDGQTKFKGTIKSVKCEGVVQIVTAIPTIN